MLIGVFPTDPRERFTNAALRVGSGRKLRVQGMERHIAGRRGFRWP